MSRLLEFDEYLCEPAQRRFERALKQPASGLVWRTGSELPTDFLHVAVPKGTPDL